MNIVIVFSLGLGLLVALGAAAMIWGDRRLSRATDLHRSG